MGFVEDSNAQTPGFAMGHGDVWAASHDKRLPEKGYTTHNIGGHHVYPEYDSLTEPGDIDTALKALEDQLVHDPKKEETHAHPEIVAPERTVDAVKENEREPSNQVEQPQIMVPHEEYTHTQKLYGWPPKDMQGHETTWNKHDEKNVPTSETKLTSLIPSTPADVNSSTSGNEDSIISDPSPAVRNMRLDTIRKIDETITKLDSQLGAVVEAGIASVHDLSYYQKLLDNAYDNFCMEINGNLMQMGTVNLGEPHEETPLNVKISADMSSALRRSFDTKVEVLELAASEVATQKSKETGARTIHDALTSGLIAIRATISSPNLTIHTASTEMKNMNAIISDISKSLLADMISWTLKENIFKKKLFDKIVAREEYIKAHVNSYDGVEKFTADIRGLAADFHTAQKEKANAIQKQNGFKEYMDIMREDINTIQRLIDAYFAAVHNGHAQAILQEASMELNKDSDAESKLRVQVAEEKVRDDEHQKSEVTDHWHCPENYKLVHADKPWSNENPCVYEIPGGQATAWMYPPQTNSVVN
ncbi:uncharacterized protein BcabD6B2_49370 [Babesia caballi]|uniref:Membrane protein, putative n=1 Tax=Babesia caballi TaxID=5871 RepID=A0AAV4M0S5_BABCB|nr:membrane protein, putative [Babesia caballi]